MFQKVFVVNMKDRHLYHIWQPERGKDWSSWKDLGGFASGNTFSSQPCFVIDPYGWWDVYGVRTKPLIINNYLLRFHKLTLLRNLFRLH